MFDCFTLLAYYSVLFIFIIILFLFSFFYFDFTFRNVDGSMSHLLSCVIFVFLFFTGILFCRNFNAKIDSLVLFFPTLIKRRVLNISFINFCYCFHYISDLACWLDFKTFCKAHVFGSL